MMLKSVPCVLAHLYKGEVNHENAPSFNNSNPNLAELHHGVELQCQGNGIEI